MLHRLKSIHPFQLSPKRKWAHCKRHMRKCTDNLVLLSRIIIKFMRHQLKLFRARGVISIMRWTMKHMLGCYRYRMSWIISGFRSKYSRKRCAWKMRQTQWEVVRVLWWATSSMHTVQVTSMSMKIMLECISNNTIPAHPTRRITGDRPTSSVLTASSRIRPCQNKRCTSSSFSNNRLQWSTSKSKGPGGEEHNKQSNKWVSLCLTLRDRCCNRMMDTGQLVRYSHLAPLKRIRKESWWYWASLRWCCYFLACL